MRIRLSRRKLSMPVSSLNYHTKLNADKKKKEKTLERINLTTGQLSFAPSVQRNDN